MVTQFSAVLGLEVHCQLATDTKIFCRCKARLPEGVSVADEKPNAHTCPTCAGHPGTLPVLNEKAVEYAIRAGLATDCEIQAKSIFARKNYFYPDLPKGYQISQYDQPLCRKGGIDIEYVVRDGAPVAQLRVPIQRIHMEEDAGKNVHTDAYSLVNLNRAGMPLVEIVTDTVEVDDPAHAPAIAGAYLRALHAIVTTIGVTDGNMQEGNFRCDANVSIMPKGAKKYGTRVEIKNVNSFRFVEKAIEYEINRQAGLIQAGEAVVQETRMYDADKNVTYSMRSKEEAHDYRYFPDPDQLTLVVPPAWVERIRGTLPELPAQRKARYMKDYGLSGYDAGLLSGAAGLAGFFEQTMALLQATTKTGKFTVEKAGKSVSNFLSGELTRLANEAGVELDSTQVKVKPQHLAELVSFVLDGSVSSSGAKTALVEAWSSGDRVDDIVERKGLRQVSDLSALAPVIDAVLAKNPSQVAELKAGKDKVIGFLVGQVMKESGGKANPALVKDLILQKVK
ncbi:MAG: Asp-tRNA(Asn)/Glu-tRNA(Gln) amidotransferase subunit GatB [Bacteriovoracia bacterium]